MLTEDAMTPNHLLAIIVVITVVAITISWYLLRKRAKNNTVKKLKEMQKKVDSLNRGIP
jgi:ABC-type transport system involved in cytochrome bd biosynthesis fused ATPase/permease subunit